MQDLQDQISFATEKGMQGSSLVGSAPQDANLLSSESDKKLKSQIGCQIHTHLLNEEYELDERDNCMYFVEFHELCG